MSTSYDSSSSDSEGNTPDFDAGELRPYLFEPERQTHPTGSSDNNQHHTPISSTRTGNTNWCSCGNCRIMETDEESLCCREAGEVPEEYFENELCITENENFRAVCIHGEVLKTTLRMLNNLRGDAINISNRSMRYAGYRQYTMWVHNRLGKGVRKVIPSCSIWAIRDAYPEIGNLGYVPFQEARDEMNA